MMKQVDLYSVFLRWKITLLVVILASATLSSLFSSSLFIRPKYRSVAVIYPSNLRSYSEESATEQMLQLFQSDSVFDHVVSHFNLIKHYRLDSTSSTVKHQLISMYNENVDIRKTEFEAVRIEVLDTDPEIACDMIYEMINAFNAFTLKLNREKSLEHVNIYKSQLLRKKKEIDSINVSLKELAVKFNLIDFESQSRELAKEYYRTVASGNERKIAQLTEAMRNLEEKGGKYHELQKHLENSTGEYAGLLVQYNTTVTDSKKVQTYTNVVVKPFPADKKAYPVRWLIVAVSVFASLLFSMILIAILEGRKSQLSQSN